MALGWIENHYTTPSFHFNYYGFEWIKPLSVTGMYAVHIIMILCACMVVAGLFYRVAITVLFLLFTYTELIDLTYYLNHYYFVTLLLFLLIWVPANADLSLDVWLSAKFPRLFKTKQIQKVARWTILIFQLQLAIVYVYAGLAKINYDWLIGALPLKIWLPSHSSMFMIGAVLKLNITAYVFSWAGMLYDTTIIFFLIWNRTRLAAYATVIIFHVLTVMLFQIGVFPLIMIGAALIFFSAQWHATVIDAVKKWLHINSRQIKTDLIAAQLRTTTFVFLILFLSFQILFPWRYVLYPGNLFWTEEGYRFSWRVMLMEKTGTAQFYVKDNATGREGVVVNSQFLNSFQENQMSTQPDMILQFAQHLKKYYKKKGIEDPGVRAEVYVTLNARPSQLLIDPHLDLTSLKDDLRHKSWILPAPGDKDN
jgi:hypothetical protein